MRTPFEMRINKWIASGFGVLLMLVGAPFLLIGLFGLYSFVFDDENSTLALILGIGAPIGAYCVWTGARMAFGAKRKEGGLFSPFALRAAGVLFAVVPLVLLFVDEPGWSTIPRIVEVGFFWLASAACFGLASRRQHPVLGRETVDGDT